MDTQETKKLYKSDTILLSDSNYYKFVFKKTEKIVCVVFYVLENTDKGHDSLVITAVLRTAQQTLDSVLQTLSYRWYSAHAALYGFLHSLIALESNVRVAHAVALVQEEVADMLSLEIESVLRALRPYLSSEKKHAPELSSFSDTLAGSRVVPSQTHRETSFVPQGSSQGQSKRQQPERHRIIKDIIAVMGQSTIKDISGKLPDLSEKTIQREITFMINQGYLIKQGERRWSRYSLVPGV
jgi:hypothetical protein